MRDTLEMAREAQMPYFWQSGEIAHLEQLKRFEALARADEREACYTIAKFNQSNHLEHLTADQIKARGETK
jgi:hypothetical protein